MSKKKNTPKPKKATDAVEETVAEPVENQADETVNADTLSTLAGTSLDASEAPLGDAENVSETLTPAEASGVEVNENKALEEQTSDTDDTDDDDALNVDDLVALSTTPTTSTISILDEGDGSFYGEEHEKERAISKRKLPLPVLLLLGIVLGVGLGICGYFIYDAVTNTTTSHYSEPATSTPEPVESVSPSDMSATDLTQAIVADTTDNLALQLKDKYGEEAVGKMELAGGVDTADSDGKKATVALATVFGVPKDFDYKKSVQFFIDATKKFDGDWKATVDTKPAQGMDWAYSVNLKDYTKNPTNPAVMNFNYFQIAGEDTMTITVEVLVYPTAETK